MRLRGAGSRRRKGTIWAVGAGLLAVAALLLAFSGGGSPPAPPVAVLVARTPIPPGTLVDEATAPELFGTVSLPAATPLAGLLGDPEAVLYRRTAVGLAEGEPVTLAAFGGAPGTGPRPLGSGERAAPIPYPPSAVGAGLRPGARVDVVASTGEGTLGRTRVVVADAEVLVVQQPADALDGEPVVVLRVDADEALRLTAATNFARDVRLLVRPDVEAGSGLEVGQQVVAP